MRKEGRAMEEEKGGGREGDKEGRTRGRVWREGGKAVHEEEEISRH